MVSFLACTESATQTADAFGVHTASFSNLLAGMSDENLIGMLAVGGWIPVVIVAMIGAFVTKVVRTRAQEQTRRDIAAYIAEGSMTPEQGEQILRAGRTNKKGFCDS